MLRLTAEKISDAACVGIAKVRKDISKGKLDAENLGDIVRYIQGHRLLAGGLKVFDGIMAKVAEVPTAFEDEGYDDLPRFDKKEKPSIEEMVGAGMLVKGFKPSYDDGQVGDVA